MYLAHASGIDIGYGAKRQFVGIDVIEKIVYLNRSYCCCDVSLQLIEQDELIAAQGKQQISKIGEYCLKHCKID